MSWRRRGFIVLGADMVSLALIGVSGFGHYHYLDVVREVERGKARIVAAAVINQEEETEKCAKLRALGAEIFSDYHEMLAKYRGRIDLCMIPTGIHWHKPMTLAALQTGMNVFVEKPAAPVIQDVRAMQAAEKSAGRFVAVGYQTMFAHETLLMKRAIVGGELGKIKTIRCRGLWPRDDAYYTRNSWAGRLKDKGEWVLDSPYNNAIAHQLNMICFLAGTELEKTAKLESIEAELYRAHAIESADTAAMRIITREGLPLYLYVTHSSRTNLDPEIEVIGDKGRIHWTFLKYRIERAGRPVEAGDSEYDMPVLRTSIMDRLFARVHDPAVFICDLAIAAAQTLCVNGAHDSSEIHTIEPQYIERTPEEKSISTVVKNLDEDIERGYLEGKLFSEMGIPWARAGNVVSLRGYERFPSV